ncbi:MAG: hypothetical protein WD825_09385 [Gemmatimonadaceae bacterium]
MKVGRALTLAAICLLASACFRQVVQTGRTPGSTVISKPWTATWVFGLVPATPIDVSAQCPSGIATVVTELSVPNWLASAITFGIYSPRTVTITCAGRAALNGGLRQFHVARGAPMADQNAVFVAAAEASNRTNMPVIVRF